MGVQIQEVTEVVRAPGATEDHRGDTEGPRASVEVVEEGEAIVAGEVVAVVEGVVVEYVLIFKKVAALGVMVVVSVIPWRVVAVGVEEGIVVVGEVEEEGNLVLVLTVTLPGI